MPTTRRRVNKRRKKNNRKWTTLLILLLLLLILLLGAALTYFVFIEPYQQKTVGGKREAAALQGSLNVMTEEEIQEALNNIVEEGMFRISLASNIIAIEDGMADVRIENNLQNRYVMQVTLTLDETGEEIYRTGLIDPGYYIQQAEFNKHLDPGEYDATAIFTALYADTEEIVGTVGANVKIHVFPSGTTPTPIPTATPAPTATAEPQGNP